MLEKQFDAGRYNILCSSGDYPPNLQGIWGGTYWPAWSGDYTLNGNVQSAIAADLPANMPECFLSMFDYFDRLMPAFHDNARRLYGARGIYIPSRTSSHGYQNHFDSEWPMTFWTAGAAWFARFYYDYYLYTGDREFPREEGSAVHEGDGPLLRGLSHRRPVTASISFPRRTRRRTGSAASGQSRLRERDDGHCRGQGTADESDRRLRGVEDRERIGCPLEKDARQDAART